MSNRANKKIYVGCAQADAHYRDLLVFGRHRWELYSKPSIDFLTSDRGKTELAEYKAMVEMKIQNADGMMFMVTAHTSNDPLALWEIEQARVLGIPTVGVDVRQRVKGTIPTGLEGKMTRYGWEWFAEFFNEL